MLYLVYITQADFFALIILGIIFMNHKKKADLTNTSNLIFLMMVVLNAVMLLFDIMLYALDGVPGQATRLLFRSATCLFYCFSAWPCLLWLSYADYFIHRDRKRLKRYALPAAVPAIALTLLSIANLFRGGLIFNVGPDNIYHRGPLFFIVPMICYLYLFYTAILILRSRKQLRHVDFLALMLVGIPPILASFLQMLFCGITPIWPSL
ncbi:MAG: hypothetical protein K0S60_646, partial [Evtepia sp.]|nr:hypothetical protein [Evtepia sp.]